MAIPKTSKYFSHWNYFIALEEDLEKVARYIEFDEDNYSTYSLELAHLLLAASSEVDVVLKELCNKIELGKNHRSMKDYRKTIQKLLPELSDEEVTIPRYGLTLNPLVNWKNDERPDWWEGYNNVKHHRDTNFKEANLKNTLNALAALSLIVIYYYKKILDEEKGTNLPFKDVTYEFHSKASLINFRDGYTYDTLVV